MPPFARATETTEREYNYVIPYLLTVADPDEHTYNNTAKHKTQKQ
jgi:hypothetical protein